MAALEKLRRFVGLLSPSDFSLPMELRSYPDWETEDPLSGSALPSALFFTSSFGLPPKLPKLNLPSPPNEPRLGATFLLVAVGDSLLDVRTPDPVRFNESGDIREAPPGCVVTTFPLGGCELEGEDALSRNDVDAATPPPLLSWASYARFSL